VIFLKHAMLAEQ